jgi:hypothetical protein
MTNSCKLIFVNLHLPSGFCSLADYNLCRALKIAWIRFYEDVTLLSGLKKEEKKKKKFLLALRDGLCLFDKEFVEEFVNTFDKTSTLVDLKKQCCAC